VLKLTYVFVCTSIHKSWVHYSVSHVTANYSHVFHSIVIWLCQYE